jgi:hypothetical protein
MVIFVVESAAQILMYREYTAILCGVPPEKSTGKPGL